MSHIATILPLGSGELGREFVIAAKRLGAAVITCDSDSFAFEGLADALAFGDVDMRLFGRPVTRPYRRMGVALARAADASAAMELGKAAVLKVRIVYD